MKRYLFTTLTSNDLGLITRSLPIARELAKKGNEIIFCSPGQAPSKLIADAGFDNQLPKHPIYHLMTMEPSLQTFYEFVRSERFREDFGNIFSFSYQLFQSIPIKMPPITSEIWNMDHISAVAGMLNKNFVRTICISLLELIESLDIDVVVDFWNPIACMAARIAQKPLSTVIQADIHPDSQGFIWWKEVPPDIPSPVPVINEILSEYSLGPINDTGELCVGDMTLVVGTPDTDPLPQTARVTYVGPILWQKENAELPEWFDNLSVDKPVIWVYSGNPSYMPRVRTPVDSAVILQVCISVLADLDAQVVLTTGYHKLPEEFNPLPVNFYYVNYVPGLTMAGRSDLMIHHGGYGSCQTGLFTGTPAVIIPTFSERESNARRIADIGAGEYILPTEGARWEKHVDTENLRIIVRKVLSDPSYAINARQISEKLRTYGGAMEAAYLIENLSRVQNDSL
jgi:UDP:flavonoid glycosyltransferase YjiC (YdhE family)